MRTPNPLQAGAIIERLGEAIATTRHEFWADDVRLLDAAIAAHAHPRPVPSYRTSAFVLPFAQRSRAAFTLTPRPRAAQICGSLTSGLRMRCLGHKCADPAC